MSLEVEWDPAKAESNLRKHGVAFAEAATVLGDRLSVTLDDPDHGGEETRFVVLGRSAADRLLIVAIAERNEKIRIISARPMTPREKRNYEQGIQG